MRDAFEWERVSVRGYGFVRERGNELRVSAKTIEFEFPNE
jgi:hypothetical protein